ncbi:C-terminal binding protein [Gordonia jinghuaiqii]|uniref:C-terminal binding protein n=1 Tax=Gordonia jinghuaiqii TaxID=2758710 RepID=A0A7D7QIE1_9ACTN|nr:C-terminal binding protein [Gordonia jinghuaiqii]MCR5977515.1 C-terminal binding protein [Gordonia jinghuaiqii]QMT02204.1 C-terminal binding protein [Gordonia jinghuaiqii]
MATDRPARNTVVIVDHPFGDVEAEREVATRHGYELHVHQCASESEVIEAVRDSKVALVNQAPMTRQAIAAMASGGTIVRYGVGYDNVDVSAAVEHGVAVANVPDYGSGTVADHAATLLLTMLRKVPEYDDAVRTRGWIAQSEVGRVRDFTVATIGMLGFGRIGRALHTRLAPFGFEIIVHDPAADEEQLRDLGIGLVSFSELLERSNAISLHLPLTTDTHHIIDERSLRLMAPDAVLVNTARGPLVDSAALAQALNSGTLGGAALDVFESEPLPSDSPLRTAPRLLLTPHTAFYSDQSLTRLQELAADEVGRALRAEPLRCRVA